MNIQKLGQDIPVPVTIFQIEGAIDVQNVLKMSGFDMFLDIYRDQGQALASFR